MTLGNVPALPKRLGKYEVGAKIGGGGMASVFLGRATREDGTEERVALKVIRDEFVHDEQFSSMFVDEAKILARLSHPNVIHTLEYGITGHHRFIAMELLSGRTFADVWDALAARGEKIAPKLGAWLCARVAEGLHSAHELVDDTGTPLSVVHRDVNPGNIFLTHTGEVKLIDFGLAKARQRLSKSVDGIVKGKIPYLAPEQARGEPIDRRIDIYALGTTLWETATMKRLFKRDTDVATLRAIQEAYVPDVRDTVPEYPARLWRIIERATARDRDARYESADEMRKDLDLVVGDARAMPGELAALLSRLFPGQEQRHEQWLQAATSVRLPLATIPPPAPLPTASSSLLEDPSPSSRKMPAATPVIGEEIRASVAGGKKTKAKGARRSSASEADDTAPVRAPVRAPQRGWVTVAVLIAVVVALALVLAAR